MTTLLTFSNTLDGLDLSSSSSSSSTRSFLGFNDSHSGSERYSLMSDTPPSSPSSLSSPELEETTKISHEQVQESVDLFTQILRENTAQNLKRAGQKFSVTGSKLWATPLSDQYLDTPKTAESLQARIVDAGYESDYEGRERRFLLIKRNRLFTRRRTKYREDDAIRSRPLPSPMRSKDNDESTPRCIMAKDNTNTSGLHRQDGSDSVESPENRPNESTIGLGICLRGEEPASCATIIAAEEIETISTEKVLSLETDSAFSHHNSTPTMPPRPMLCPVKLGLDTPSPVVPLPLPEIVGCSASKPRLRPIRVDLGSPSPILPLPPPHLSKSLSPFASLPSHYSTASPKSRLQTVPLPPSSSKMTPFDIRLQNHSEKRKSYQKLGHGLPSCTYNRFPGTLPLAGSSKRMTTSLPDGDQALAVSLSSLSTSAAISTPGVYTPMQPQTLYMTSNPTFNPSSDQCVRRIPNLRILPRTSPFRTRRLFTILETNNDCDPAPGAGGYNGTSMDERSASRFLF
ncbi:hypothetical protein K435DRAFT_964597 [Dendrothele bispora CBS 962.96]|uniref:Uncharacterized protein n=1 Tax=Dendrothele bispora (strain CBS 962.96) TaxID=1314807 RepID=A0A4S8M9R5_DENBC|nr:hypothetical protein K435DRAFT_964597 [Dendrothele bispora CBS 962.96]